MLLFSYEHELAAGRHRTTENLHTVTEMDAHLTGPLPPLKRHKPTGKGRQRGKIHTWGGRDGEKYVHSVRISGFSFRTEKICCIARQDASKLKLVHFSRAPPAADGRILRKCTEGLSAHLLSAPGGRMSQQVGIAASLGSCSSLASLSCSSPPPPSLFFAVRECEPVGARELNAVLQRADFAPAPPAAAACCGGF